MADDKFRQERRKITPDDLGDEPATPPAKQPTQQWQQPSEEGQPRFEAREEDPRSKWVSATDRPEGEDTITPKVSGNIPARYQKMFAQGSQATKHKKAQRSDEEQFAAANVRVTGSSKLEELVSKLRPDSGQFEEIRLPSRGRFYDDENGPENGLLNIRPMTGEEEQILTQPRFVKKGQAINMIFQRCLKEGFRPESLLSVDRTYMLIWLRGISYSSDYEVDVTCPFTDRKFSTTIDLGKLLIQYCPDDYGPDLTDVLPRSGYRFKYRLSTGKDEQDVQEYRDMIIRKGGDSGRDDSLIYRTALLLEDIEGLTDKQELVMLIKKLPIQDVAYLRTTVTEPPFGVDTKIQLTSPYTSDEFEIDLPLETAFFFPKMKKK